MSIATTLELLRVELAASLNNKMVAIPKKDVLNSWLNERNIVSFFRKWEESGFDETYKPCIEPQYTTSMFTIQLNEMQLTIEGLNRGSIYKTRVGKEFPCQIYNNLDDAWIDNPNVHNIDMQDCINGLLPKCGGFTWRRKSPPISMESLWTPFFISVLCVAGLALWALASNSGCI